LLLVITVNDYMSLEQRMHTMLTKAITDSKKKQQFMKFNDASTNERTILFLENISLLYVFIVL